MSKGFRAIPHVFKTLASGPARLTSIPCHLFFDSFLWRLCFQPALFCPVAAAAVAAPPLPPAHLLQAPFMFRRAAMPRPIRPTTLPITQVRVVSLTGAISQSPFTFPHQRLLRRARQLWRASTSGRRRWDAHCIRSRRTRRQPICRCRICPTTNPPIAVASLLWV